MGGLSKQTKHPRQGPRSQFLSQGPKQGKDATSEQVRPEDSPRWNKGSEAQKADVLEGQEMEFEVKAGKGSLRGQPRAVYT